MANKSKILHIASFTGNIGDNASHLGFREILSTLNKDVTIDQIEIRRSYGNYAGKNKLQFDESFAGLTDDYDLVIFGGGAFLDYWIPNSSNGTTIDIPTKVLDMVSTSILITSVGAYPHKKVPAGNHDKFERFLEYIVDSKKINLAFRNDGSLLHLKSTFKSVDLSGFPEILDNAFFWDLQPEYNSLYELPFVAINITNDQMGMGNVLVNEEEYYRELRELVRKIIDRGKKVVFVPHIHEDLIAITKFFNGKFDYKFRENIFVTPCVQNNLGAENSFNIYKFAEFVVASRFHANVCSMNFGCNVIGLSPLPRVKYLHESLDTPDTYLNLAPGFSDRILTKIDEDHVCKKNIVEKIRQKKAESLSVYAKYI